MKLIGNIKRHLTLIHSTEADIVSLKRANKARQLAETRRLITDGDAKYNKEHPENCIVRRKSAVGSRDVCPSCKIMLSRHHIVRHIRRCGAVCSMKSARSIRVDVEKRKISLHDKINEYMKKKVIPFMRNGEIKQLCMEDESIILYGNKLSERFLGENQEKTIRNHLRIVARVALKTMEKDDLIAEVLDVYKATKYDAFVEAIHDISGHGQDYGMEMKKPTTPHQYGLRMRDLSDYIVTSLMKKIEPANSKDHSQLELKTKIETIQGWQAVYDREFDKQVASLGRRQAERRSFETRQFIPSKDDVKKLIEFVEQMTIQSYNSLKRDFSANQFMILNKCLLLKLWIFNRRRVGEVENIQLDQWSNARDITEGSDDFESLLPTEQLAASSFRRVCVQGKLRRTIALLVPKRDWKCYKLLISLRQKALVPESNEFLFANNKKGHIQGTKVMREFAKKCGAEHWWLLTGTRLRKQLATCLRYLNLSDEDLRLVAEVMGHTEKTHIMHYRKHNAALHAGRASKLLIAMNEGGISEFTGKSLKEIDLLQSPSKGPCEVE